MKYSVKSERGGTEWRILFWARWVGGSWFGISLSVCCLLFVPRWVASDPPWRPALRDPPGRPTPGTHPGRPTQRDPPGATHPPRSYHPLAGVRYMYIYNIHVFYI